MKLTKLTVYNFMPYKGMQSIDFPQNETQNVVVIFGDNMRGKTSLLNAMRWGFYETAISRHSKNIPLYQLPNKDSGLEGDWKMEVSIEFEANGSKYHLRRIAVKKPLVVRPERDEDFQVSVHLLKDSMPVDGFLIQSEINKFAPEQVSRFFLFDGELLQEYETLLIEGNEQGKQIKAAIEQVLGVPALINGRDYASQSLKKAQKAQNQDLLQNSNASNLIENRKNHQAKLESIENDTRDLKRKLSVLKEERDTLNDDLDGLDAVHKSKLTIDSKTEELQRIKEDQKTLIAQKYQLLPNAWKVLVQKQISEHVSSLKTRYETITNEITTKGALQHQLDHLRGIINLSVCPTCDQTVPEHYRKQAGTRLGQLESELTSIDRTQELGRISNEITIFNSFSNSQVINALTLIDSQDKQNEIRSIKIENEIQRLKEEIKGYDTAEISRMRSRSEGLIKNITRTEDAISANEKEQQRINKELRVIDTTINNLPQARAIRSSRLVNLYSSLERVFSESIERLRDSLRSQVEQASSEAFSKLTTQKKYSRLRINSNYGLTILDERSEPVEIRSAGAEQIVALSLIDGLCRTGRSAGPVVMDTPFGRLDLKHRDNILSYLPTAAKQLILLVHDGEIRNRSDLSAIASRIGGTYRIVEKGPRHSQLEKDS